MKPAVHRRLSELSEAAGKEYGKLAQKLLALAFLEAGAESLTERSTQGIDLEVRLDGRDLALEVKTCEASTLRLGKKDLAGLAAREAEGRAAHLAVLGSRLIDEWIVARFFPGELAPSQTRYLLELRPYRVPALESRISAPFESAVLAHAAAAASWGQRALDEVLRGHAAYRPA